MNYKLIFFIILIGFVSTDVFAQAKKIQTVVIDPGHGGRDPGGVGKKSKEKDIVLAVSKKVGSEIKKKYPDVRVLYTRTTDVFVDLIDRAKFANRNNADLFISIHCNAVGSRQANGIETWIMGASRDAANLSVAKRENASILYESNAEEKYGGFDPNSTEAYIAFSLIQSEFKQRSLEFADLVQNEMVVATKHRDRGVQQAGFMVLYKTAMPSVLIELEFITNQTQEDYLLSTAGQNTFVSAIVSAFGKYKTNCEKNAVELQQEEVEDRNQSQTESRSVVDKNQGVVYKVQFASKSRKVDNPQNVYKNLQDVDYYEHNGMYKYTAGCFRNKADADAYLKEVIAKGYTDAFVVKFEDGVRK